MQKNTVEQPASPATYALLGQLASRSWTGYELTQQVHRSLRFTWPTSEGHLYREQKRLVKLGWASVDTEPAGKRTRKRYAITESGRTALQEWLRTPPHEPQLHVEGILRAFYADRGDVEDLRQSLLATARMAKSMHGDMLSIVEEYLEEGGPLWMLEHGIGGPGAERQEFRDRPMFPERLHAVALAIDGVTRVLTTIWEISEQIAADVENWPSTDDESLTPQTRTRLEAIRDRGLDPARDHV